MASDCVVKLVEALSSTNLSDQAQTLAAAICGSVASTSEHLAEVENGLNTFLLLFGGALVFLMHGGFAMLEAGAIRSKNAMNILLQTLLDASASAIMWYLVGFGFAFGINTDPEHKPNAFIGNALFGLARYKTHFTGSNTGDWTDWFFQWAFCATAVTIPAGAVAERFNFNAYLGYSAFIAGFVYPVLAHWAWCLEGWLGYGVNKPLFNAGYIDFAGSGVIHMCGGLAGLIGATMVGPRLGRFDSDGNPVDMPGHNAVLVVLGTVLLWFGWYGFNPCSILAIGTTAYADVLGRAAVTTTLAGASGGISCLLNGFRRHRGWDLVGLCNGVLCGFVAITACCHVVEPWAAIICGAVAGVWFDFLCWLLLKLKIDDPLSAGPMHFGCGMWGVFFTGLLAKQEYIMQAYTHQPSTWVNDVDGVEVPYLSTDDMYPYGAFYKGSNGLLIACQVIGILAIIGWVSVLMIPFFGIFKRFKALRIPPEVEEMGLDRSKHGGSAYNGNGVLLPTTMPTQLSKVLPMSN